MDDPASKGKNRQELFDVLIKDRTDIFAADAPKPGQVILPPIGNTGGQQAAKKETPTFF